MKLSLEDKIEIVRLCEEGHSSFKTIATQFNVRATIVQTIFYRYKKHGLDALRHPSKKQQYSADFKMKILNLVYEGRSKTSLAAEYNLPGSGIIVAWMHKYEESGYNGLISTAKGRPKKDMKPETKTTTDITNSSPLTDSERKEFEELKRRYEILKKEKEFSDMENEFLKKLDALVLERLKREKKK